MSKYNLTKSFPPKQFIKFCTVGGISAVIHYSVLHSLTEGFGVWYLYSNTFGFIASAIFNFFANKFWTFRDKELGHRAFRQSLKFIIVLTAGLLINTGIIYSLKEWAGFDYRLAWIFATGSLTFWNFLFNRVWTFRLKSEKPAGLV